MRMQPTDELLAIWREVIRNSYRGGFDFDWRWGGRGDSNSISDAEQLLCLLYPATQVAGMALDSPDETTDGVLQAVQRIGDSREVPRRLTTVMREYFGRHTDPGTGQALFGGDGYLEAAEPGEAVTPRQKSMDLVSSYSISVTLCLAVIGFVRVFRQHVRRNVLQQDLEDLENLASRRLSAAMVGLLRSFVVDAFDDDSPAGDVMLGRTNQTALPRRRLLERLRLELQDTAATLRDFRIGSGAITDEAATKLFECGWSWGVVRDAPTVPTSDPVEIQPDGVAEDEPYLVFTVEAMQAIDELASERTRLLGLLNDEQQRLAQELRRRGDVTRAFWSTMATFGDGAWPIEDVPWRTSDGSESDYFTVMVAWLTIGGVGAPATPNGWARFGAVLSELATRGRINRRAMAGDSALVHHHPGFVVRLPGAETIGPEVGLAFNDYAPLLLECTARVAGETQTTEQRQRHLDLADAIWSHLSRRRHAGLMRLWDQPNQVFAELPELAGPSWFYTARVVRALVVTAGSLTDPPPPSERLTEYAADLLAEAERMFDQEMLRASTRTPGDVMRHDFDGTRNGLRRAREIFNDHPGAATALILDAMRRLDALGVARMNAESD
nr:SCO2524 family protein [Dactylosporangium thailandense]